MDELAHCTDYFVRAVRALVLLFCALLLPVTASAAKPPKAELWERWTRNDPASNRVLNHSLWAQFLSRHVKTGPDGINRVDYGGIGSDDGGLLRVYLDEMQRVEVSKLRKEEQRAYWINIYNALTIKLVMERYPLASVQQIEISPGFFEKGPRGAKILKVEDETLSLDEVEHRVLRPIWKDPRIHYALCYGALGGPNLAKEPYTASNTEMLLEVGARQFVNHARGALVDEKGKLRVSSLYKWFAVDFGEGNDADVISHLRYYAIPPLSDQLAEVRKISSDAYDWRLNDGSQPQAGSPEAPEPETKSFRDEVWPTGR